MKFFAALRIADFAMKFATKIGVDLYALMAAGTPEAAAEKYLTQNKASIEGPGLLASAREEITTLTAALDSAKKENDELLAKGKTALDALQVALDVANAEIAAIKGGLADAGMKLPEAVTGKVTERTAVAKCATDFGSIKARERLAKHGINEPIAAEPSAVTHRSFSLMKMLRSIPLLVCALLAQFAVLGKAVAALTCVVAYNVLKASPFGAPVIALGANTLTNLIPDAYAALNVVSRELVGFIPAVMRDAKADRLAVGQSLRSSQAPVNTAGKNITAAMALPAAADQVIGNIPFTIQKARAFPFSWTGEEQASVDQGPGFLTIQQQQIAQAIRAAVNEIELDIATAASAGASRAHGTVGTIPFTTNLGDPAQVRKILDDNGAPKTDRHLVIDTTAGANLRTLAQLTKVNESGDVSMLRQGELLNIHGFAIRESAQIITPTAGTAASATTDNAGYAVGATVLTLASAGTGTLIAGDIVTFAGDTNKYVIASGDADVSGGGTITLAAPGLRKAMSAATKAITVVAAAARNVAFSRDAILLGARLPALTTPGDMAILRETLTDDVSGLSFELAVYPGYRMCTFEIGIAWGVAIEKAAHTALLIG